MLQLGLGLHFSGVKLTQSFLQLRLHRRMHSKSAGIISSGF